MKNIVPIACLAMFVPAARAQQAQPAPAPQPAAIQVKPAQVTVTGSRADDTETRRLSTASKMVFGREELDRNGDTSVGEVLKRLPGITLGGRPGRGGGARMHGMGNGYTQMLVNGQRPPPGFSLESLSPDQVERIEVMRGPVAEHSTQAIAGTINIVLREGYRQKDVQVALADNVEAGRHGAQLSLGVPGQRGALDWLLNGSLFVRGNHDESSTRNLDFADASGATVKDQLVQDASDSRTRGIHLAPRVAYRFAGGDTINFTPFLMSARTDGDATSDIDQRSGVAAPEYSHLAGRSESSSTFLRGFGNWLHRMDAGAKLDVKFGFGRAHSDSENRRDEYNGSTLAVRRFDGDETRDRGVNTGGKYSRPAGQGHLLAAGWDIETSHREQTRTSLENGVARFPDSGVALSADTRRLAAFVQDEWDVTRQFSTYLGLRWEGIRTTSSSSSVDVRNTSSVWSPVLHGVYRIPGHDKDQLRASLTRAYKAPGLNDLVAAPSFSTRNSATAPDSVGNPQLKPELSTGIDLAYEHYLAHGGILSASGFVKNIDQLIRRDIALRDTGRGPRWVSTPANVGKASTRGIELEAKFQLAEFMKGAPNVDLRSNYSRYWSSVDGIPGPNNRLDQQARQTANVGIDYRLAKLPLTLGGSMNWTPPVVVQTSASETVTAGVKRQLDVYGLWKFSPGRQLRFSASNLTADDYESGRIVAANGVTATASTRARTYTVWGVKFEMKI